MSGPSHGANSVFRPPRFAPFTFNANGDVATFPVAAVPGTFDFSAAFDGTREVRQPLTITAIRLTQLRAGAAGGTTVEIFRRRAGVNTLLLALTILSGAGNHGSVSAAPALAGILSGDQLFMHFTAVQAAPAKDISVQIELI